MVTYSGLLNPSLIRWIKRGFFYIRGNPSIFSRLYWYFGTLFFPSSVPLASIFIWQIVLMCIGPRSSPWLAWLLRTLFHCLRVLSLMLPASPLCGLWSWLPLVFLFIWCRPNYIPGNQFCRSHSLLFVAGCLLGNPPAARLVSTINFSMLHITLE